MGNNIIENEKEQLKKEIKYLEKEKRWYTHISYDINQLIEESERLEKAGIDILTKDNSGIVRRIMRKLARHIRRSYRWYIRLIRYSRILKKDLNIDFNYEHELKVYENSLIATVARHGELWDIIKGLHTKTISLSNFKLKITQIDKELKGLITIIEEWYKKLEEFENQIEEKLEYKTTYHDIMKDVEIFNRAMERDIERGSVEDVEKEFEYILDEFSKELNKVLKDNDRVAIEWLKEGLKNVEQEFKKIKSLRYPKEKAEEIKKMIKRVEEQLNKT